MAGGNFVSRVISMVVDELIINSIAKSQVFQRFVARTSNGIDDLSRIAAEKRRGITKQVKDLSRNVQESLNKK